MPALAPVAPEVDIFDQLEAGFETAKQQEAAIAAEAEQAKAVVEAIPLPQVNKVPYWIEQCHKDYQSGIAHVFIFHGNITDYPDQGSARFPMELFLSQIFDSTWVYKRRKAAAPKDLTIQKPNMDMVFAYYTMNAGLVYPDSDSRELVQKMVLEFYGGGMNTDELESIMKPGTDIMDVMRALNRIFEASKGNVLWNRDLTKKGKPRTEVKLTVCFFNANYCFPNGPILHLQNDRSPVAYVYNWAQDGLFADRNKVLLFTPSLDDLHETIRGGDSGVSAIMIRRPNLEEREHWLKTFDANLPKLPVEKQPAVGGKRRTSVTYGADVNAHIMAVQTAGLNLKQQEQIIRASWRNNQPIDFGLIREQKQRAIQEAFAGLVDFVEPEFGFEQIGGHDRLKEYFWRKAIGPMQRGDKRSCSRGVVLSGPPGTGKTMIALALARESRMNFLKADLSRVFGGIVGDTERNIRRLFAAVDSAAPCTLFLDELESVLSSGRSSPGDSGTSARVFNSVMTYLSDESRAGKVFVVAATNRPDMLDPALIRPGRFDAILPALPPAPGDAQGRTNILKALCLKHKVRLDPNISKTGSSPTNGIGRLLNSEHIWTGAEVEVVLKEAVDNCLFRKEREVLQKILLAREEITIPEDGEERVKFLKTFVLPKDVETKLTNPGQTAIQVLTEKERDTFYLETSESGKKPIINLEDWNEAMDAVQPNTRDVDLQIKLALKHVNNFKYVPEDWLEMAKNRDDLQKSIDSYSVGESSFSRE